MREEPPPSIAVSKRSGWAGIAFRLLMTAGVVTLCVLLFRQLEPRRLLATLKSADLRLVAIAVILNLTINAVARVLRWKSLLGPLPRRDEGAGFWELAALLFASQAASNLLPARAGEVLRTLEPHRRHGYPVGALIASQLVEKVVEATSLSLVALPLLLLPGSRPPRPIAISLYVLLGCGFFGILGVVVVAWFAPKMRAAAAGDSYPRFARMSAKGKLFVAARPAWVQRAVAGGWQFIARLTEAVELMHSLRVWLGALAWSCVSDLTDVAMVALCLVAVGVHVGPAGWFITFVAVNVAIAIPSTPGQVGVLEAGAVLVLGALGIGQDKALAFALIYHAAHLIPPTVIGLVGPLRPLRLLRGTTGGLSRPPSIEQSATEPSPTARGPRGNDQTFL